MSAGCAGGRFRGTGVHRTRRRVSSMGTEGAEVLRESVDSREGFASSVWWKGREAAFGVMA